MACIDSQQIDIVINRYSSRKLWELLAHEASPSRNAPLANAIYRELYRRGDFHPRAWTAAPF